MWYNPKSGRTEFRRTVYKPKKYNLSKVTLKDGKYYDALNNYIGNSSGIFQGAFSYLLNKYGKT